MSNMPAMPDTDGNFGEYGGQIIPPPLIEIMNQINDAYDEIKNSATFKDELASLYADYVGRPSPIYHAKNLSNKLGGAQIYLKREDLNHTGAHKINHCIGEALLAKHMGKTKVLAETGAGCINSNIVFKQQKRAIIQVGGVTFNQYLGVITGSGSKCQ